MIELTWIPEALRAVFWAYVVVGPIALICALAFPKGWRRKLGWSAVVLATWIWIPKALAPPPATPQQIEEKKKWIAQRDAARTRFKALCETAGERIDQTVEGVDGFLLMRMRPESTNETDQFAMNDPYGRRGTSGGERFIQSFLVDTYNAAKVKGRIEYKERPAYSYIDVIDEGAHRYRYTVKFVLRNPEIFTHGEGDYVLVKEDAMNLPSPRYGVTWEDISTKEDRQLWIAGGSLKVIDLKENKVIAERRGYMMDPFQGSTAGYRSPWIGAGDSDPCPTWKEHHRPFVSKVLIRSVK